ncbi:hypothetical protein ACFYXJ_36105 [Streptomyces sp. NPDC002667]|uniref:hypothetical protein n=1 Tax=Streptomyces sp. NPDC002667 TaxID=3364657 RepID=UPI0036CBCA43
MAVAKDVRDVWTIKQSNGPEVHFTINQQDHDGTFASRDNAAKYSGDHGTIDDARATLDEISFLVKWSQGPKGRYVGRFDFQGRLTGFTFDETAPSNQATWVCIDKTFGDFEP